MKNKARKNLDQNECIDFILSVPKEYRDLSKNAQLSILIDKFNNSKTIEEQIIQLHSFAGILNAPSTENTEIVLRILTYLFLETNSKHPVKKSILRIFSSAKNLEKNISVELSGQLAKLIDSKNQNNIVNVINDCFSNFPAGILAVSSILDKIFPFLVDFLKIYCKELCLELSPMNVQELYKNVHNYSRAIVAVTQQCENINQIFERHLDDIVQICMKIFSISDISYDTKSNCGIILTIAADISFEKGYKKLLDTCLVENTLISEWNISFQNLNDEITITCIFSGILNTVKSKKLSENAVFTMTEKLLEISENSADKPSVVLGVNRTLLLVSRALETLSPEKLIDILRILLDYVWTQIDHNIDTIRHISKSILVNLVKLGTQKNVSESTNNTVPLNIIMDSVLNLPVLKSGRYIALSIVANETGVDILLNKNPNLICQLRNLTQESSISSYTISCYENLMRHHLKGTSEEIWLQKWVFPLTTELTNDVELNEKGSCYQKLLISAIKLRPPIVNSILSRWSTENEVQFSSLLKCALIARNIGADLKETEKWRGMLDYSILEMAMCHQNDEIRVSSLSLITDSHKSTEIFTEWELNFVVTFLHFNINTQLPAVRQRILFLMKKILTRFSESYYAIIRNCSKVTQSEKEIHEKKYYEEFIFNLRECIFDSLFPGANFSRRIICLEILTSLEPILNGITKNLALECKIWKQSEVDALKICLEDSYESNKQLTVNLLRKCPLDLLKLDTTESTKLFITDAIKLASSNKPADTITAAYMFETSMYSPVINNVLKELLNEKQIFSSEYLIVEVLLYHLKRQIEIGTENLLKAAGSSPMYGILFCIRHLMEKYLFEANLTETNWKILIEDIILSCFKVSEIVCPVVNSSSPEGHLPMDHEAVGTQEINSKIVDTKEKVLQGINADANSIIESQNEENSSESDEVVTAQMLLVCSWRSIKEVSLLLGEIVLKGKIIGENPNGFITEEQILKIGEHFTVLLTETKHRGAFEQAYVGFNKLCQRLWRCRSNTLHQLPIIWLDEIILAISGEKSLQTNKLCATRRSAGVPFMIQAIVSSELQTGSNIHFHKCMDKLLKLANSSDENIEKRTHSMNILRALYRHTQLGEDISPYIAQGVVASINGFSRKTWAERNAATLLFSSLMTRIFGVQRTKDTDHLNIRNKMTARVFFLRYPILYNFLLNLLQELTNDNCPHYKNVALYPILLLLARLYSSTSSEHYSEYQLQNFVPFVRICAKNIALKTRELSAKALVQLVETQNRKTLMKELFTMLKNRNESKNHIHGILLQIFYFVRALIYEDLDDLETEINDTLWLLRCDSTHFCPVLTALYIHIIYTIISRNEHFTTTTEIYSILSAQDSWIQKNCTFGTTIYYKEAINLQLTILLQKQDVSKISTFLIQQISRENKIVNEFVINFLICLLHDSKSSVYIDNLELPDLEKKSLKSISKDLRTNLISAIKNEHKDITEELNLLIRNHANLTPKILFIFSYFDDSWQTNYIQFLKKYPDDSEILTSIVSTFPNLVKNIENLPQIISIMLKTASSNFEYCCRYYTALTLLELKPVIFGTIAINFDMLIDIWRIIMILLTDNEPIVRNSVSKLASNSPIAEKAREELLLKCIEVIQKTSENKCISLLIFWSLTVFDDNNDDEDIELQIFERGETSTYIEDMCLSKLCSKHLSFFHHDDVRDISIICTKIITIIQEDILWSDYKEDKNNLITVLTEIQDAENFKNYFQSKTNFWTNLDVYNKYKILNILKSIMPKNILQD